MESVEVAELGRASILTLMLKQILDRNLLDPQKAGVMQGRVLTVHVRARDMRTTVFFEPARVRAEDGGHGRPDLVITGDMRSLLSLALGGGLLRALLGGGLRIRIRGWRGLWYGLRLTLLMQLGPPPAYLRWLTGARSERGESP